MNTTKPKKTILFLRTGSVFLLCWVSVTVVFSAQDSAYTLDELIALGLERNPRLAAGALEVAAREAAYQAAKRFFNPEVEFRLGRAESHDRLENRGTFGLAITQPIENPFKRQPRIAIQKNAWEEKLHVYDYQALEAVFEIKVRFFSLLLLQQKEILLREIADSIRETYLLIQKRADLGEVKQLEAIKLHVETLKAEKELTALRAEKELARENLNILLDNSLPPDFKVSGELEFRQVPLNLDSLLSRALSEHPLIQAGRQRLEQTRSNISYVKGQRLPDVALTGFSDSELDGVNRGVGITLVLPLWNFKGKELAEAVNLSRMREEELRADQMELAQEIRSNLRRVELAEETLSIFTTALLGQVEESLKIAEVSYREGEISLLDFLDSQRTYNSILADYYQALFTWNAETAALEKAVGESIR